MGESFVMVKKSPPFNKAEPLIRRVESNRERHGAIGRVLRSQHLFESAIAGLEEGQFCPEIYQ
jgi:hypothetical protein